jgi:2-aminoadipate transaminase
MPEFGVFSDRQRIMTPRISLSATSERTTSSAISSLMSQALAEPGLVSLAAGFVDQATLPIEETSREVAALMRDAAEGRRALQYGTTAGDVALRTRLIGLVEESEGAAAGSYEHLLPRTVVATGSQQLLYLLAEALLDPGDIVLVESPTYFVFLGVLESRGARVIGVETDEHGLRLDALDEALAHLDAEGQLARVKLIYTVSEHSNPSGISLGADRRGPLVALARKWSKSQRIFVLEDSAYRGLTYDGVEPPSVWRHDPKGDTVILARTFSKTYSPGLKTGYGVLPDALVEPVLRLKGSHDFGSANFNQVLIERLIADGSYERHVRSLVARYRLKRDVMLDAMDEHLGPFESLTWTHPAGGLYIWLTLPEGLDTGMAGPFFQRCVREGVIYVPGACAFADEPGPAPRNHTRLCFGVPGEDELIEGVRRLAKALAGCRDLVA